MPSLSSIATVAFPYRVAQKEVKTYARELFRPSYPNIDRMMDAYDHTGISTRNFCKPLGYYGEAHSFSEQNDDYCAITLAWSVHAIEDCLTQANIAKETVTDLIFVSTTGLATPSMDARIINSMGLPASIRRTPIFGLGCAGGVAGYARAHTMAVADPQAVVVLVAAELCSLTFLRHDFSKSNFIGSGLFADGIAACIITGDQAGAPRNGPSCIGAQSKLYPDTLDIMGWDFSTEGFKVLFSQDIPSLVAQHIREDVQSFLNRYGLALEDIRHFIFHPGGTKVLAAYEASLTLPGAALEHTRAVMQHNGNMSGPTVLYVLEQFMKQENREGYGLMLAMGPGFSSEMVLLEFSS